MIQWIRPQTLNREVPGLKLLAAAVVPLGKALYPQLPSPLGKDLELLVPWLLDYKQIAFLVARPPPTQYYLGYAYMLVPSL